MVLPSHILASTQCTTHNQLTLHLEKKLKKKKKTLYILLLFIMLKHSQISYC